MKDNVNRENWGDIFSDAVVALDRNLRIISFSREAERITGYSPQKVIGLPCPEVLRANFCDQICPVKRTLETGEKVFNFGINITNVNNEKIPILVDTTPLYDYQGKVIGVIQTFKSIAEVYQLSIDLLQKETRLQTVLNSIADGVFTVDTQWRITSFNPAAERITGYQEEEVMNKPCHSVFRSPACSEGCPLRRTLESGQSIYNFEMEILNSRGQVIPISVSTALLIDEEGEVMGGVETFRDLSLIKTLSEELQERHSFGNIIGKNAQMQEIYNLLKMVSETSSTVLIQGETGTGKELVARAIHYNSPRKDQPFIKVSCAALPETLLESELFGYKKGAFTGAIKDKPGKFELAHGGTIFLDEIGEISIPIQTKLLRVLEDKEFEPLGGTETIKVDVRVITATNRNLKDAVEKGQFREDLYYRLNVIPIILPPLRERSDDIPLLVNHFIAKFNQKMSKEIISVSSRAMALLVDYPWPGNIRQLEHALEHAFIHCSERIIEVEHLPQEIREEETNLVKMVLGSSKPFDEIERQVILETLRRNHGNREKTAQALGISRTTLWRKLKKYAINSFLLPG